MRSATLFVLLCLMPLMTGFWFLPTEKRTEADRLAVYVMLGRMKLAANPPWVSGTSDCSKHAWDLLEWVLPELKVYEWFVRTNAATMATWPFPEYPKPEVALGDVVFCLNKYGAVKHVMSGWMPDGPDGYAIHASSSKGYVRSPYKPYWWPKMRQTVLRPPWKKGTL